MKSERQPGPPARQLKPMPARAGAKGEIPFSGARRSTNSPGQTRRSVNGHKSGHNDPLLTILEDASVTIVAT